MIGSYISSEPGYTLAEGGKDAVISVYTSLQEELLCLCVCLAYVNVVALHECRCMYVHGDKWLRSCRADGIVMTLDGTVPSDAVGSSITWNGTWVLVIEVTCLSACLRTRLKKGQWPIPFPAD